ncbi:HPr-rel-A system PqqD family peptide chaperone [Sphingomonas sp.]|uniref:HPr-rel-A system PqqD family peptide chaperone n=1 Tax=Sphingomonas sp. TaxID=28214 RepID=UPI002DD69BA7|nr:HPr-rel-A system PqqD family peptide chaperone [Sphingomonas sp.]
MTPDARRHDQQGRGEVRYLAADPRTIRVVPLDSLTAIYHRASGITHLVASPVPELLAALDEPRTVRSLLDHLAREYELGDADPVALGERLTELEAAGLVRRA